MVRLHEFKGVRWLFLLVFAGLGLMLLREAWVSTSMAAEVPPGMVDTSRYKKPPPWTVARAGLGDLNAWMVMFSAHYEYGIKEKYKNLFKDYFVTAANFNPMKQISDVESLLARKIDLLFIDPATEGALVGVVEKAMDMGIPVVLGSTRVQTDKFVTWVTRNNEQAGVLYARWMVKKLKGKGNVIVLMGFAGSSYAEDVLRGVRKVLRANKEIKEVGLCNCNWSPVKAKKAVEAFLQRTPRIDGIISDGGQMALGALEAFLDAGKPMPPVTADEWNGWLGAAKKHKVDFLAVSAGQPMSLYAVDLAVKIFRGEPVPKVVEYPIVTFGKEDIDKYYRADLSDQYWGIHLLPPDWIQKLYGKRKP
ncbi:MAG: substrate-binding domain-containing protein [Nitrospinota bacterium]